jgi:hypothetical protein
VLVGYRLFDFMWFDLVVGTFVANFNYSSTDPF